MSSRVQIYFLLAASMLFALYGVIGSLVITFVVENSRLHAYTLPFTLVGVLGLYLTSMFSRLSDRIDRLERLQASSSREPSEAVSANPKY